MIYPLKLPGSESSLKLTGFVSNPLEEGKSDPDHNQIRKLCKTIVSNRLWNYSSYLYSKQIWYSTVQVKLYDDNIFKYCFFHTNIPGVKAIIYLNSYIYTHMEQFLISLNTPFPGLRVRIWVFYNDPDSYFEKKKSTPDPILIRTSYLNSLFIQSFLSISTLSRI